MPSSAPAFQDVPLTPTQAAHAGFVDVPMFHATNEKDAAGNAVIDTGVSGALKGVGEGLTDLGLNPVADVRGLSQLVHEPRQALAADARSHLEPLESAQAAFQGGDYKGAAVDLLRYLLHGIGMGSTVDAAAQEYDKGEHAKALSHVITFVGGAGALGGLSARAGAAPADAATRADLLRREANDQVANQVLAPANPKYKGLAQKIAPELLDRGLEGDRLHLQQAADDIRAQGAAEINQGLEAYGLDKTVPIDRMLKGLTERIQERQVNGQTIRGEEGKVAALEDLRDSLKQAAAPRSAGGRFAPGKMTLADIRNIADRWGTQAEQEGGYRVAQTPESSKMADQAWAAREARSIINRDLAERIPALKAGAANYHFGKALADILNPALGRPRAVNAVTSGATGGLHMTGAFIGNAFGRAISKLPGGEGVAALIGSQLLPKLREAVRSPEWQLVRASQKIEMAKALEAGKPQLAMQILRAVMPTASSAGAGLSEAGMSGGLAPVPAAQKEGSRPQ